MAFRTPLLAGSNPGEFADVRTVGVVGAGVAGLQMTRALLAHGYEAECDAMRQWKHRWMPNKEQRAAMVLLHHTHYHDQLLLDMGEKPARKGCFLSECFCPYMPSDYNGIIKSEVSKTP